MAFEIIKSFAAIQAAIHGFAGSGTKLTDEFRMKRITAGTRNGLLLKHFCRAKLLFRIGGCNTKFF